jgi:hypothetical protein
MKAPVKRMGRAPLKNDAAPASSKLTKISSTQDLVERADRFLAGINHYRLPDGPEAARVLDLCETFDGIRTKLREKAKELLLREPNAIPGYHVSEVPQRVLSKDTARVFDALSREDDRLTPERFLDACTTNLGGVRKLLGEQNPEWTPDELEHVLNRVLVDLIHFESVVRLSRSKGKQIEPLSL